MHRMGHHHAVQSSSTSLFWQHWHETGALLMSRGVRLCSCVPCCAVLRQLVQEGSAEFVGYNNSILMQLLAGACVDIFIA